MTRNHRQQGGALRGLLMLLVAVVVIIGGMAWLSPKSLPKVLRVHLLGEPEDPRDDPTSPQYAPAVYRWKDAQGRTQITDQPPEGRPYETVRISPDTNVVPSPARGGDE